MWIASRPSAIENIQSLIDEGVLYLDPHAPYQPLDLAVGCLAARRVPYDSDCSQCEYCPSYKPRVCALFCPPTEAATSLISIGQTSTPRPHLPSASPSSTLPIEDFYTTSIVSSIQSPLYLLPIFVGAIVIVLFALFAALVSFCFFKLFRMRFDHILSFPHIPIVFTYFPSICSAPVHRIALLLGLLPIPGGRVICCFLVYALDMSVFTILSSFSSQACNNKCKLSVYHAGRRRGNPKPDVENPLDAEADAEAHALADSIALEDVRPDALRPAHGNRERERAHALTPVRYDAAAAEVEVPLVPAPRAPPRGASPDPGRNPTRETRDSPADLHSSTESHYSHSQSRQPHGQRHRDRHDAAAGSVLHQPHEAASPSPLVRTHGHGATFDVNPYNTLPVVQAIVPAPISLLLPGDHCALSPAATLPPQLNVPMERVARITGIAPFTFLSLVYRTELIW